MTIEGKKFKPDSINETCTARATLTRHLVTQILKNPENGEIKTAVESIVISILKDRVVKLKARSDKLQRYINFRPFISVRQVRVNPE